MSAIERVTIGALKPHVVDLLAGALAYVWRRLDGDDPINIRVRKLWAGVVAARDLGASDVVYNEFVFLADEMGLTAQLPGGREDVEHVVRWGLRGWCPFGTARSRVPEPHVLKVGLERELIGVERGASILDSSTRHQWRGGATS